MCSSFLLIFTDVVSDSDFTEVIQLVGVEDRYDLYQALNNISDHDVETAELNAYPRSVDFKARAVLYKWRLQNGDKATRQALLDGLEKCGNVEAKEILEDIWNGRGNSELYDNKTKNKAKQNGNDKSYHRFCMVIILIIVWS